MKFEKLLQMIDDFPTLPTVYSSLNDVISDKDATAEDVARVVVQDQATTVKLLKVANSPMYGFVSKVDNITKAVQYIGFNEVRNIVMAISVMKLFKRENTEYDAKIIELWKHSIATGITARVLAGKLGIREKENYFIAGVLHDIGKLFFYHVFKKLYFQMVLQAKEQKLNLNAFEKKKFTIDHGEIGYMLGKNWQLPESLLTTIKYHETGLVDGEFFKETAIVHIANFIVQMLELGDSGNFILSRPNKDVVNKLGISSKILEEIKDEIIEGYQDSVSILDMN